MQNLRRKWNCLPIHGLQEKLCFFPSRIFGTLPPANGCSENEQLIGVVTVRSHCAESFFFPGHPVTFAATLKCFF